MFDMLDMRDMGGCRDFGLMPPMWLWLVLVRPALTGAPPYPPPPWGTLPRQALGRGLWPMTVLLSSHGYFHPHAEWRAEDCARCTRQPCTPCSPKSGLPTAQIRASFSTAWAPSTDASGALGQERPSYDGVVEGGVEGA
jgi:hypothetical protein